MRLMSVDSDSTMEPNEPNEQNEPSASNEPNEPLNQQKLCSIYVQEIEFHNEIIGYLLKILHILSYLTRAILMTSLIFLHISPFSSG